MEKYSSAFTLSDMEIFIFPDLFYPLVLANIMSPLIWKWRDDPWFEGIDKKGFNYKVNRIKQYIIDNYVFNLDLATWGMTTKTKEIERFSDFFDIAALRPVSYTHLRAHETPEHLVCRLLLEKKKPPPPPPTHPPPQATSIPSTI